MDPVRGRKVLTRIGFEDFEVLMNRTTHNGHRRSEDRKPKEVTKTHAEWWLSSPRRRQYIGGVVFDPYGKGHTRVLEFMDGFYRRTGPRRLEPDAGSHPPRDLLR